MRMLVFSAVAFAIIGGGAFYVGARLSSGLPPPWRGVAWLAVIALVALIPAGFWLMRAGKLGALGSAFGWASNLGMGLFSLLLAFLLAGEAVRVLLLLADAGEALAGSPAPADPERRRVLFGLVNAGVVALAGFVTLAGIPSARRLARVEEVDVPIPGLPPSLHGFRIAQVSDLHVGPTIGRAYVAAVVDRVNALAPHLVAITGDLVDGTVAALAGEVAPLTGLRSRHGTFFVTGNHEYYSGVEPWLAHVASMGIVPLVNAHRVVEHDGGRLLVAGITDHRAGGLVPAHAPDPAAAARGAPPHHARLLLAHQPRSAFSAAEVGFDLMLAGHTHGGQFFPWTVVVRLVEPFAVGLHRLGKMWIYTNRGTGYWGPPNRLGSPSEITLVRLVRGE